MRERPILMSTEMVKAVQDGRKTQTRRVIKNIPPRENGTQYDRSEIHGPELFTPAVIDKSGDIQPGAEIFGIYDDYGDWGFKCPYGQPGDRLWVKETWAADCTCENPDCNGVIYKAGYTGKLMPYAWKPSIHMFRRHSRITLEITDIRAERVQDISLGDISKEGIEVRYSVDWVDFMYKDYQFLWNSINAKRGYSWELNPWVWVIEFKRLESE